MLLNLSILKTQHKNLGELQPNYCSSFGIMVQQHLCADSLALIYTEVT